MMKEAQRVLQDGGLIIGSVAFLEPFHGNSYYHHSHLGTFNSLKLGGFHVLAISPNPRWNVLDAQAAMGLFPKMPTGISKLIILPVKWLHFIWWRLGGLISRESIEQRRILETTGSFFFIAQK